MASLPTPITGAGPNLPRSGSSYLFSLHPKGCMGCKLASRLWNSTPWLTEVQISPHVLACCAPKIRIAFECWGVQDGGRKLSGEKQ